MGNSEPDHQNNSKVGLWVVGVCGVAIFALATYMNYGPGFRHASATDIGATVAPASPATEK